MTNGLTIGIPVYNEADRIEDAIRSAAPQCTTLIVADNASTDGTGAICQSLAREYGNMQYFRHARNTGARRNSEFILDRVSTPYFMLLGGHDRIDADYTSSILDAMSSDADIVAGMGGLRFEYSDHTEDARSFNSWNGGLQHDAFSRVRSFLFDRAPLGWTAYAIFRTDAYRHCYSPDIPSYGIDIIFMTRILTHGRLIIAGRTRYHAWIGRRASTGPDYLERITANAHSQKARKRMRNDFRVAQYQALMHFFPDAGMARKLRMRYMAMVRFGIFRLPGHDILYYPLFLPVKITRSLARPFRSDRADD